MSKKYKNIFKLLLIITVSIISVIYLRGLYQNYKKYDLSIPVIMNTVKEIKEEEIGNYIFENPTTLLYGCTSFEDKCRSFEEDLKLHLKKHDLGDKIIYLNLNDKDSKKVIKNLKDNYKYSRKVNTYPFILYFKEGKIIDHLDSKNKQLLTISLFEDFIKIYEIGNNND